MSEPIENFLALNNELDADFACAEAEKSNDPVKYVHIRLTEALYHCGKLTYQPLPRGGVTVAYFLLPEEGQQWDVQFAVAECSDRDNYNKSTGRAIARGRLASVKHAKSFLISDQTSGSALTGAVIDHALQSLPRWADVTGEEIEDGGQYAFSGPYALTVNGNPK